MRSVRRNLTKLNDMEKPKFCVDCRWCVSKKAKYGAFHACGNEVSIRSKGVDAFDRVTGREIDPFERMRMCGTMRDACDLCGPDARLWEGK